VTATQMLLKLKKIVLMSAAMVALVAWSTSWLLETRFFHYARTANATEGTIVPHVVKGVTVYITRGEERSIHWLGWILLGSGSIMAVVLLIHGGDPFNSKPDGR
jgi:hypothetical protein